MPQLGAFVSHYTLWFICSSVQSLISSGRTCRRTRDTRQPRNFLRSHVPSANQLTAYLEVEDAGVSVVKVLVTGDDSGQGLLFKGQGCNGRQEPAVSCGDKQGALWVSELKRVGGLGGHGKRFVGVNQPSCPWQMSVLSASPTMNRGLLQISCGAETGTGWFVSRHKKMTVVR